MSGQTLSVADFVEDASLAFKVSFNNSEQPYLSMLLLIEPGSVAALVLVTYDMFLQLPEAVDHLYW